MTRTTALIVLGILIVVTPFSGLPISFRSFLAVVFGACVFAIGLFMRVREARGSSQAPEPEAVPPSPPPSMSAM